VRHATIDTGESPGVRYRHYAPDCEIRRLPNDIDTLHPSNDLAVLVMHDRVDCFVRAGFKTYDRGSSLAECAQRLYQSYAQADQDGIKIMYVQALPEYGLGTAIMNRARKSVMR
jgi:L-threonylcarbamoyladenylate synthase